ncbi:MAG: type II CAAX endopeptidase family protein [Actinomycetaceae bacterium]|nr:type II CAAX endopeptidase family protein [Actinomycetaceae bacterium]
MLHLPQIQPRTPAEYHQMAAGPDRRWYRPLLVLLIFAAIFIPLNVFVTVIPAFIPSIATEGYLGILQGEIDTTDPIVLAVLMFSLIAMIPAILVAVTVGLRMGLGYFFSVEGRLRWKWQFISFAIAAAIFALFYSPIFLVLEDVEWNTPGNLPLLIVMIFLLVPFQSAAEELAIRASFLQIFGSWIPHRWASLVVATLSSAAVFSLLHGSLDAWILLDLVIFSLAAVFLMWHTGGVEAAIALHAGNNVVIFVLEAIRGTSTSLISAETTSSPISVGISFVMMGTVTLVLALVAKKMKLTRRHNPDNTPKPDPVYLYNNLSKGRYFEEWNDLYPAYVLQRAGIFPSRLG